MRRIDKSKEFKGSVFVEFTDFETVDKFLNADQKPTWEGQELLVMSKCAFHPSQKFGCSLYILREAYCEMKIKEKGLTGKSAAVRKESIAKRGFNAFHEMAKGKSLPSSSAKTEKPDIKLEFMGSKIPVQVEDGVGSVNKEDVPFVPGATLKFEGDVGDVSFNQIKVQASLHGVHTTF
jgi:lupus La protein